MAQAGDGHAFVTELLHGFRYSRRWARNVPP
jgi:hypothetical protein